MANLIGILSAAWLVFIWYVSGLGIKNLLNIKNNNPFASIVLGFFAFNAYSAVIMLPFQWFDMNIIDFVYIYLGFISIYFILSFISIRSWLSTTVFNLKLLQFFLVLCVVFGCLYGFNKVLTSGNGVFENTKTNLDNIYNNFIINGLKLSKLQDLDHYYELFFTSYFLIDVLFGHSVYDINHFIKSYSYLVVTFLLASLFIEVWDSFCNSKKQYVRWLVLIFSLGIYCLLIFSIIYLEISIFNYTFYFFLLIAYLCTLVIKYTINKFPEQNFSFLIGISMGSFMWFSKEGAYPIILLLYCFIFVIQLRLKVGYFRDISRMSWITLFEFIVYNIISRLWVQTTIFGVAFIVLTLSYLSSKSRYFLETKFELYLQQRNIIAVFVLPIIFFAISAGYFLAHKKGFDLENSNYINYIFWWLVGIKDETAKGVSILVLSLAIVSFSISWMFIRQRVNKNPIFAMIDIFSISFLTFYNPFFTDAIKFLENSLYDTGGFCIIAMLFMTILLIPFEITNLMSSKLEKEVKITIHKKPSRLII